MSTSTVSKFSFPQLRRVELERFSLFARHPDIALNVTPGVFCLAGANGIGKSTFLTAVNFALTGRVPTPKRAYSSTDEYVKDSLDFSKTYFEGRIADEDAPTASITLNFVIGDLAFSLTRGMFEPEALRMLRIERAQKGGTTLVLDGEKLTDTQRQLEYAKQLAAAIGLRSFEQFVFLQHFVLTFDESRNLLFWNGLALESTLFLVFDADPTQQTVAESYRRKMERADSRGRNYRYHAHRLQERIDAISSVVAPSKRPTKRAIELEAEYNALLQRRSKAQEVVAAAEVVATDADVEFANASAEVMALRGEYSKAFSDHMNEGSVATRHPVIAQLRSEKKCVICGTEGEAVVQAVEAKLEAHACPLCSGPLSRGKAPADAMKALRDLDKRLTAANARLDLFAQKRERHAVALQAARKTSEAAAGAAAEFEVGNGDVARRVKGRAASIGGAEEELARLMEEQQRLLQESKEAYAERDDWKGKLKHAQKALERQYQAAEKEFVPLFRDLAEEFLGMELDIVVEPRGTTGLALVLDLRHSKRRLEHQLSESQRFFLDIALRMALARFISHPNARATLFCDTPEGSLDIAYESRAGSMFAKFADSGHNIIMTANINTSELLRELASECGNELMSLIRMTDWSELSEVQRNGSKLFKRAYAQIEGDLHGGDGK